MRHVLLFPGSLFAAVLCLLLAAGCTDTRESMRESQAAEQVELVQAVTAEAEASVAAAESALETGDYQTAFESAESAMLRAQQSEVLLESAANSYGESTVDYETNAGRIQSVGMKAQSIFKTLTPPAMAQALPPPPRPPAQATAGNKLLDLGIHLYDTEDGPARNFGYYTYVAFPSSAQSSCAQRRYVARHVLDILSDVPRLSKALGVQDNSLLAGLLVPVHPQFREAIPTIQAEKDENLLLTAYNYPYARQFVRALGLDEDGVYLLAYPVPFEDLDAAPDDDALGMIDLTGANEKRVAGAIKELRSLATIRSYEFRQQPDRLAVAMVAAFEAVGNFLSDFGATEARASDVSCP